MFDAERHECPVIFPRLACGRNAPGEGKYPASPLDLCSMQAVSRMLASDVQISRPGTTRILRMVRHAETHVLTQRVSN